ncbi:radical SAM protein [Leadbettera azotonutricia]|uniref:FeMo cofactor biosynthesis protein NifB n=1 Tax=Leadbettera azotonutricia (strain ATCC BAA-888 / DSM 13862 / ZAS-9) TaxID=545695 RepID=F5Y9P9_LEAAZ|nr:radical SAM protein [Leadbettera azotonutricia]AEF82765.1 nitrogenase cofactor biosynthesis protein NifB [Leadbettera azotonutricia ZAS-9]
MDFGNHPCFNSEVRHSTGRIHLPVAAKCNIQCNFCNRKYDCVNENRPGVTSAILSPFQALDYLGMVMEKMEEKTPIAVIGIAGPGDPFANAEETLATMELVHEKYPEKILCLATNGLGLAEYSGRLVNLNISHVTITVNAVDPEIGAKIYSWVRFGPKVYRGIEGAKVLLERQTEAIKVLKSLGIIVKINTVIIPGVNDTHAAKIAEYCANLGADIQNCIPMMHVEGSAFENIPSLNPGDMLPIRNEAFKYIKQMSHCARCRADAAGLIGDQNSGELDRLLAEASIPKPTSKRPYLAIASMEGLFVNRHLGEATQLWVFGIEKGKLVLCEQRSTPEPGSGNTRWETLANTFSDCFALLAANCGATPKKVLESLSLPVITGEGLITDLAASLLGGRGIPRVFTAQRKPGNGQGCTGSGMGCGA